MCRGPRLRTPALVGYFKFFAGIAVGSHNTHTGGGANVLCTDLNVSYTAGHYLNGHQGRNLDQVVFLKKKYNSAYCADFSGHLVKMVNPLYRVVFCFFCQWS